MDVYNDTGVSSLLSILTIVSIIVWLQRSRETESHASRVLAVTLTHVPGLALPHLLPESALFPTGFHLTK